MRYIHYIHLLCSSVVDVNETATTFKVNCKFVRLSGISQSFCTNNFWLYSVSAFGFGLCLSSALEMSFKIVVLLSLNTLLKFHIMHRQTQSLLRLPRSTFPYQCTQHIHRRTPCPRRTCALAEERKTKNIERSFRRNQRSRKDTFGPHYLHTSKASLASKSAFLCRRRNEKTQNETEEQRPQICRSHSILPSPSFSKNHRIATESTQGSIYKFFADTNANFAMCICMTRNQIITFHMHDNFLRFRSNQSDAARR